MAKTLKVNKVPKKTQKAERAERALLPVVHPGFVFSSRHHVFIAKLKRGELWALNHLTPAQKAITTPLFEMWPPPVPQPPKQVPGKPPKPTPNAKTLQQHASDLLGSVLSDWGKLPFFLDTAYVPAGGVPSPQSADIIFQAARNLKLFAVPVTALRFAPAYQAQIAAIAAKDGWGAMVRLRLEDFVDPTLLAGYLNAIPQALGLPRNKIDIMLDLAHRSERVLVSQLGNVNLGHIPFPNEWRTLTLAAGCFPSSISNWNTGQWLTVERSEWLGWNDVRAWRAQAGARQASHGDYGVRCGGEPLFIPNTPAPNLRYTLANHIAVRKGEKVDGHMKAICADLIIKPEFAGDHFSEGDRQIALKAAMPGSPNNGQAEQWIQWCTNHHLVLTISQIQSLPAV